MPRKNNFGLGCRLHDAVWANDLVRAQGLVKKGASVNFNEESRRPLLCIATFRENLKMVRFLLGKGADVNALDKDGSTPLLMASRRNNWKMARMFIDAGADVNARDGSGMTPLHGATGDSEILQFLLECNAEMDARDKWGDTPLHNAAADGKVKALEVLVAAGADVEIRNNKGLTACDVFPELKKIIERDIGENAARRHAAFIRAHQERIRKIAPKPGPRL